MNQTGLLNSAPMGLGIVGLGTVGCALIEILEDQADWVTKKTGRAVRVVAVNARTKDRERPIDISKYIWCDTPLEVAEHPEVDVLVELTGGTDMPFVIAKAALSQGKPWISANKALLAEKSASLIDIAYQNSCPVGFEAAVCGAIPAIKTLRESLAGSQISQISGILNGTCNYIFAQMADNHSFQDALADAQAKGYAEADPTLDIEGIDAAHKIALMAALASGQEIAFDQLLIEGISSTPATASVVLSKYGYVVKLIGQAVLKENAWQVLVTPMAVASDHPLATVNGVTNAVIFHGDASGELMLTGAGAGGMATASAVMSDIIDIAANRGVIGGGLPQASSDSSSLLPALEQQHGYIIATSGNVHEAFADAEKVGEGVYRLTPRPHKDVMQAIERHDFLEYNDFWIRLAE